MGAIGLLMRLQRSLSRMSRSHRSVHNSWQSDREGRAAAGLALDRNVTTHHLTEAFADREPKAGATVFARRGCVSLRELLKQLALLLRRHPDAGVGNRDRNPVAAVFLALPRVYANGAALGEFVGVAHQIEQGLPQPHRVGMQRLNCAIAVDSDPIAVLGCQRFDGPNDLVDHRWKRKGSENQLHPPRLDL